MSKKYDFQKAKMIIEKQKDLIETAALGMGEDWFWTAESVFEEGQFTQDLSSISTIGGLDGTSWATPVLRIHYVDGTEKVFECFIGESSGSNPFGKFLTSGVLSSEVQKNMPVSEPYEN